MSAHRFLAVDLGAGGGRVMEGRLEGGRLKLEEIRRFQNEMMEVEGHLHWNIEYLQDQVLCGLEDCASRGPLEGIGIDTWGVDFGLLGPDGRLLGPPFCYRDHRTDGAIEDFFRIVPRERVFALTGIQVLTINSLFQLYSMVRDGSSQIKRASDILFIPDIFNHLLSGIKATEFTYATTTQLYNPAKGGWEDGLFSAMGLSTDLMQNIVDPGTVLGPVRSDICRGIDNAGTVVIAPGTHDTASAVAAVPARGDDWAFISCGTWSPMGVEVKEPVLSRRAMELNFTNEGGVGGGFRLLKNITGMWLLQQCMKEWDKGTSLDYPTLMDMARAAEPFRSIIDPDDSLFLSPSSMTGAVGKFCRDSGQPEPSAPGEFVRCILESIALRYRQVLGEIREVSPGPVNRLHIVGGGSRNDLLCRFTADATGLPVTAGPAEATALGNIMVQAMSLGCGDSIDELRRVVSRSFEIVHYEPQDHDTWAQPYRRFLLLGSEK